MSEGVREGRTDRQTDSGPLIFTVPCMIRSPTKVCDIGLVGELETLRTPDMDPER